MAVFTGLHRTKKSLVDNSYRPFIELSCDFCQSLAQDKEWQLSSPLAVADVGARGGFDPRWDLFGEHCVQIGFEPEREEFDKVVRKIQKDGKSSQHHIVNEALSNKSGRRTLHITKEPAASSLYEPNQAFFDRLPDPTPHQVVKKVEVEVTTLDQCKLPIDGCVDVLKMDVQGAELDILKGSQKHIQNGMLAVIAETMFTPQYKNQPFFAEMDIFLREQGFCLIDIDFRRWRRRLLPEEFNGIRIGQVTYADVVYLKDPVEFPEKFCNPKIERDAFLKLIALAEYLSVPDYGIEMAETALKKKILSKEEFDKVTGLLKQNKILKHNERNRVPSD